MFKKKNPDRKKKRILKRVILLGSSVAVSLVLAGFGVYGFWQIKMHQKQYVSPLPTIQSAQASQKGDMIDTLKSGLNKQNIAYTSIARAKDGALIVTLQDGGQVTFSPQKDIILQIASLQYILSHLTMEGKLFTRLDLRFEKPVIVLK